MPKSTKYSSQTSIWTYENGTIKNKYNIKDAKKLEELEKYIVNMNIAMLNTSDIIEGKLDENYLLKIHKFLFEDLYDFAGKIRNENIIKGETLFCQFYLINEQLKDLFNSLREQNPKTREEIAKVITHYYAELNMIHPFREGNGRVMRVFFKEYAKRRKFKLLWSKTEKQELIDAVIHTVNYDETKLYKIILKCLEN